MKGVILAGGTGSRLYPLTKVTNKHLLPVYNKPMIYYPLYAMKRAGITSVLIVSGKGHSGSFLELLGSGSQFGMKLSYEVQEEAGGIAQALSLAEDFTGKDKFMVILGDNIIEDDLTAAVEDFKNQEKGAKVFLKEVVNPQAYGVVEYKEGKVSGIIEKPLNPPSNHAVVGVYMYDESVFDVVKQLKPSNRNELEITDVNNFYLNAGSLSCNLLSGFWGDCGESFDSLVEATKLVQGSHLASVNERLLFVGEREHSSLKPALDANSEILLEGALEIGKIN